MRNHGFSLLLGSMIACGGGGGGGTSDTGTTTTASTGPDGTTTSSTDPSTTSTSTSDSSTSSASSTGVAESSSGGTVADSDSGESTAPVEFTLTSPAFAEGEGIPGIHHVNGGNVSPQLDWVGAPPGTMSFGVFFHDITIDFEHSAIWDIPADATGLPEDIEHVAMPTDVPGALQCRSWTNQFGYGGPGSQANFYEFTLYALDVATLEEVTTDSNRVQVRAALEAHAIATATLSGQSTGP